MITLDMLVLQMQTDNFLSIKDFRSITENIPSRPMATHLRMFDGDGKKLEDENL